QDRQLLPVADKVYPSRPYLRGKHWRNLAPMGSIPSRENYRSPYTTRPITRRTSSLITPPARPDLETEARGRSERQKQTAHRRGWGRYAKSLRRRRKQRSQWLAPTLAAMLRATRSLAV